MEAIFPAEHGFSRLHVGRRFSVSWEFSDQHESVSSWVYEVYGPKHQVLYVGVTDGFAGRWSAHLSKSQWAPQAPVECVVLLGFESRRAARITEASLIDEHKPPFNRKPETKYLSIARRDGMPDEAVVAALKPTGWRHR